LQRKIWLLSGGRLGDLKLMESVAQTLGWPFEVKPLRFRKGLRSASFFWSRLALQPGCENPFETGMPDLVLCAEAPTATLAAEAKKVGGHFKLVSLARPRNQFELFDLIIAPPQYPLPVRPNIIRIPFSPHILPDLEAGQKHLEVTHNLSQLPRPITGFLVGGTSRPDILNVATARILCARLAERKKVTGGSVIMITSPRTGKSVEDELDRSKPDGTLLLRWQNGVASHYPGVLSVADEFVVTNDSVSMTIESLLTGKNVFLISLQREKSITDHLLHVLERSATGRATLDRGLVRRRAEREQFFAVLKQKYRLFDFSVSALPQSGEPLVSTAVEAADHIRNLFAEFR
jgi:uncharacterized protein